MHVFKAALTAVLPTYTSCYTRETKLNKMLLMESLY